MDICIQDGVLKDILTEQKSEVIQMVLELIRKKLAKGSSLEKIARELETDLETVQKLADQI